MLPKILFITSYPPRECGIATYSQDLIAALNNKFNQSFDIEICPLESENEKHFYPEEIEYTLNVDQSNSFIQLVNNINENDHIHSIVIQHEFGFFEKKESHFIEFLDALTKPVVLVFHTVLPNPNESLKTNVQTLSSLVESIIVMTNSSAHILVNDYHISRSGITVIPHGTHLIPNANKDMLKNKYHVSGKRVLATFGLLSAGKSIETTLDALPAIIEKNPEVLFLIIGKTHPSVVLSEAEKYREMIEAKVYELNLQQHVKFINKFLPLPELLDYLQLTDIYLFTSKDPNQAVSGTFSYAISCGCPVISTPIPHAREVLQHDAGIIVDFEDSYQLANAVINLLNDEQLRKNISANGLQRMASTAWENSAISHAKLFEKIGHDKIKLHYTIPPLNLDHIKKLTTDVGLIQFSKMNQPDIDSGYTLDDNARALIALCKHFELTRDEEDLNYIFIYFNFIKYCLQSEGHFLNYVNEQGTFTTQNYSTNLADANGRAIWALGYLISIGDILPEELILDAELILQRTLPTIYKIYSTRAMAFVIKGLYYRNLKNKSIEYISLIRHLADRLVQMFRHESEPGWLWFESYLTYANSLLPEALLCAWLATGELRYKEIAKSSFDFLLSKTFRGNTMKVISNKKWLRKSDHTMHIDGIGGEQPIDVAYTIIALSKFQEVFNTNEYVLKLEISFNWFLGNNHLNEIIYNPCTGGCYDGLEENCVNLNQGAESTVSYLMARMEIEKLVGKNPEINYKKERKMKRGVQAQLI